MAECPQPTVWHGKQTEAVKLQCPVTDITGTFTSQPPHVALRLQLEANSVTEHQSLISCHDLISNNKPMSNNDLLLTVLCQATLGVVAIGRPLQPQKLVQRPVTLGVWDSVNATNTPVCTPVLLTLHKDLMMGGLT